MRRGEHAAVPARLWWTVPLGLAIVSAVVFVSVVMPALAGGPAVPVKLVVPVASSPVATASRSPSPTTTKKSASPRPAATTGPVRLTPSATVVVPRQPVVRESDDHSEHNGTSGSGESGDR